MPFLNFGGNKNKYRYLSYMNFFKNRYSDPDPFWTRIRIHFSKWIYCMFLFLEVSAEEAARIEEMKRAPRKVEPTPAPKVELKK